jgi:hypothetical protein
MLESDGALMKLDARAHTVLAAPVLAALYTHFFRLNKHSAFRQTMGMQEPIIVCRREFRPEVGMAFT